LVLDIAEERLYHLIDSFAMPFLLYLPVTAMVHIVVPQPYKSCLFALVECRAFARRKLPQPREVSPPGTGFGQIAFELIMLGTAYSKVRNNAHGAPVENHEEQSTRRANKRQILFSPIVRYHLPASTTNHMNGIDRSMPALTQGRLRNSRIAGITGRNERNRSSPMDRDCIRYGDH
jgi:hypothetical protein